MFQVFRLRTLKSGIKYVKVVRIICVYGIFVVPLHCLSEEGHGVIRKPFGAFFDILAYYILMQVLRYLCRYMFNKIRTYCFTRKQACLHKLQKL